MSINVSKPSITREITPLLLPFSVREQIHDFILKECSFYWVLIFGLGQHHLVKNYFLQIHQDFILTFRLVFMVKTLHPWKKSVESILKTASKRNAYYFHPRALR